MKMKYKLKTIEYILLANANLNRFEVYLELNQDLIKCFKKNTLMNELYYNAKLNNLAIDKSEIYKNMILKRRDNRFSFYNDLITEAQLGTEINKPLNEEFISDILFNSRKLTFDKQSMSKILKYSEAPLLDYLVNTAVIFGSVQKEKPFTISNREIANVINNILLKKNHKSDFNFFMSEIVYHNRTNFDSRLFQFHQAENNDFIDLFILMFAKQMEKNIVRIKKTIQLYTDNNLRIARLPIKSSQILEIHQFLLSNPIFTINDYNEQLNIAYNTGKAQLNFLVESEILVKSKISKQNGFEYRELLTI